MPRPHPQFVSPIQLHVSLLATMLWIEGMKLSGNRAYRRVSEVCHQMPERPWIEELTHVSKEQDLSTAVLQSEVQCSGFAAPWYPDQGYLAAVGEYDGIGLVG